MAADVVRDFLFPHLAEAAEDVRWKLSELPWDSVRPDLAPPELKALVRDMAFFEHATHSATQRFLQGFSEDIDFTQWVAVWFYEETKHPHALMKWLSLVGEPCDAPFVARGRVSAPFVKSKAGTLAFNVLSEITASEAYLALARTVDEPLLAAICRRIGADEARHAATFFAYARRRIAASDQASRDRLDVLKVLHLWLTESENVTHPVNQTMQKARALQEKVGVRPDFDAVLARSCRVIGELVGEPLAAPADVSPTLQRLMLARAGTAA